MDSITAILNGEMNRGKESMVFDYGYGYGDGYGDDGIL